MSDEEDKTLTTSGSSSLASSSVTAAVAVKPPAFDKASVTRWFTVVESQFVLANIMVFNTKFHHVLSYLPLEMINKLSDEVINSSNYGKLKQALIALFTRSKPEFFDSCE